MTTMRCEDVRDMLPALARGALRDGDARAVREHLAGCDDCARAWSVVGALAGARPSAPAGLADRVSAELGRRGAAPRRVRPLRWVGAAGLAAAAVIAIVIAWPEAAEDAQPRGSAVVEAVAGDPFLDAALFGATTPTEAELDGMLRVAALDPASLPPIESDVDGDAPALAMDVGSPLGDWPGANGMSAGVMQVDEMTLDEMELLLQEMEI